MLSSIRKFSNSFLAKIVIGLIALPLFLDLVWVIFTGKQNILVEINNEKITHKNLSIIFKK